MADDLATTCATFTDLPVPTGSRSACVSSAGAYDMVGNVWELTADWQPLATGCTQWGPDMGNDITCVGLTDEPIDPIQFRGPWRGMLRQVGVRLFRVETTSPVPGMPSSVIRGGNFAIEERAGVHAIFASIPPNTQSRSTGFRCAR
jgi:formylglycine-generating enzyme required for sulfatase activity